MKVIYDELNPIEFFNYGGIVIVGGSNPSEIKNINEWEKITNTHKWTFDYINTIKGGDAYIGIMHFKFDEKNRWFKYVGNLPKFKSKDPYGINNVNFSLITPDNTKWWDKFAKQRLEYGFDDTEIWNLDLTIAKFILPRVERLQKTFTGYPGFLHGEDEWKEILGKICKAFRLYVNCDNNCIEDVGTIRLLYRDDNPDKLEKALKDHEEYEEGINLFFKYWRWLGC